MRLGTNQREALPQAIRSATAVLCLVSAFIFPVETRSAESVLPGSDSHRIVHEGRIRALGADEIHPGTPMMLDPGFAGVPFNAGLRDSRRLELRLAEPLTLQGGSQLDSGTEASILGLGATLQLPLGAGLSLSAGVDHVLTEDQFRSLGSIHCHNGILRPDSYTASGCRFVDDSASRFDRRTLSMGPQFEVGNLVASLRWFTSDSTHEPGLSTAFTPWRASAQLIDPALMMAAPGVALGAGGLSPSYVQAETSGIDLDFEVGFTTDHAGDIRLGLALTRIYGASYEGLQGLAASPLQWNIAAPFDTASMNIEWSRGDFSGGLRGYYREPVSFLDRSTLDSAGTFDVHFTWRTPWNANLSVGASNILSEGVESSAGSDKQADRFESIYGRIPYVRYQQDL